MSLNSQQFTAGKAGAVAYSTGDTLTAGGAAVLLLSFNLSGVSFAGFSIGLGVSDRAAWSNAGGIEFELKINGQRKVLIVDELCTLLDKEFFPMALPVNAKVELFGRNSTTADIDVAAFMRAEAG